MTDYFDKPTIRYCVVHKSTQFTYNTGDHAPGLQCAAPRKDKECDENCWLDFELAEEQGVQIPENFDGDVEDYADGYGRRLNTWLDCDGCEVLCRMTELRAVGNRLLCEDCRDELTQDPGGDDEEEA